MKTTRTFTADAGDVSTNLSGPDAIEKDLDNINKMFDPLATHEDASGGGVGTENIQDNAITDDKIGDRTPDETIATAFTGTGKISVLFSFIAKLIKAITGKSNWYTLPSNNIETIDTQVTTNKNNLETHKHDDVYYSKTELQPYLVGGDTLIKVEAFTITSADNGDDTFTYEDKDSTPIIDTLTAEGYQQFTLLEGLYQLGENRIEIFVNDSIHKSVASGGVIEVDNTKIQLTEAESNGTEITIKYFERVGLLGEHAITHEEGGSDAITVTENMLESTLAIKINTAREDATKSLVVETRTDDPPSPIIGQIWMRTD